MLEKLNQVVRKLIEDYEPDSPIEYEVLVSLLAADLYKELVVKAAPRGRCGD